MRKTIRVGTRGSDLALAQTGSVIDALRQANPDVEFTLEIIRTSGDRDQSSPISGLGYGVFVSELERALAEERIDIAVHSLKDMPSILEPGFRIAAVPYREDPRDVLVSKSGAGLMELPHGAAVGTGSIRRKALLLDKRPDLDVVPIRGNVPTRLEKLGSEDGPDAIVIAAAGLKRLGLKDRVTQYLKCWDFVAAVGQGALAVEVRASDPDIFDITKALEHKETRAAVDAERAFLATIEGGCSAPTSAHAQVRDGKILVHAFAASPDGRKVLRGKREGSPAEGVQLGEQLAKELLEAGAGDLLRTPSKGAG